MRCGRVHKEPVGLRRTGNRREPAVEHREFSDQRGEDRQILGLEALHDGVRQIAGYGEGLLDESQHGGGGAGTEDLLHDVFEGVAGVRVDELGVVGDADALGFGVLGGVRVALAAGEAVDGRVDGLLHPAEHVVEGAVLEDEDHDGADGLRERIGAMGFVEERGDDDKEGEKNGEGRDPLGFGVGSWHGLEMG